MPLFVFGQSVYTPTKETLTKIYTQAIADFIDAANQKNNTAFDTLYIGKRVNGQPDDFPDIELPTTIKNTQVRLIAPELADIKQKERKRNIHINLMGWVSKETAEFIFVVFSNGFTHQYDYDISYNYNAAGNRFSLNKLKFKGPPFNK